MYIQRACRKWQVRFFCTGKEVMPMECDCICCCYENQFNFRRCHINEKICFFTCRGLEYGKADVGAVKDNDPAFKEAYGDGLRLFFATLAFMLFSSTGSYIFYIQRCIFLLPRLLSHVMRWLTGIEIHPGAKIGKGFSSTMEWESLSVKQRK